MNYHIPPHLRPPAAPQIDPAVKETLVLLADVPELKDTPYLHWSKMCMFLNTHNPFDDKNKTFRHENCFFLSIFGSPAAQTVYFFKIANVWKQYKISKLKLENNIEIVFDRLNDTNLVINDIAQNKTETMKRKQLFDNWLILLDKDKGHYLHNNEKNSSYYFANISTKAFCRAFHSTYTLTLATKVTGRQFAKPTGTGDEAMKQVVASYLKQYPDRVCMHRVRNNIEGITDNADFELQGPTLTNEIIWSCQPLTKDKAK